MLNKTLVGLPTFPKDQLRKLFPLEISKDFTDPDIIAAKESVSKIDLSWMEGTHSDITDLLEIVGDTDTFFKSVSSRANTLTSEITRFVSLQLRTENFRSLDKAKIPAFKKCFAGWQRLEKGVCSDVKSPPHFSVGFVDTETYVNRNQVPLIGQLLTEEGLFLWLNPGLILNDESKLVEFIPLEGESELNPSILFAHNSAFDAGKLSGTFTGTLQYMDTLSMSVATSAFTKERSLGAIYKELCGKSLDKETRQVFVKMKSLEELHNAWNESLRYSLGDINPLVEVTEVLWPLYLKHRPNPISVLGHAVLSTQALPVDPTVNDPLIAEFEPRLHQLADRVKDIVLRCADETLEDGVTIFTAELDWELVAEKGSGSKKYKEWLGLPKWYAVMQHELRREGMYNGVKISQLGAKYTCVMYLYDKYTNLPLTLVDRTKFTGWFEHESYPLYKNSENPSIRDSISSAFGKEQNRINQISSLRLSEDEISLLRVFGEFSRQIGWLRQLLFESKFNSEGLYSLGSGAAVHATLSGRCGRGLATLVKSKAERHLPFSETRARVCAANGYKLVGFDLDSAEAVYASLYGAVNPHDATAILPVGVTKFEIATMAGRKSDKTDYHSTVAKMVNVLRDAAKVVNLGSLYGMGTKKLAWSLIGKVKEISSFDEAFKIAEKTKEAKFGAKDFSGNYHGGLESEYHNFIQRHTNLPNDQFSELFLGAKPPEDYAESASAFKRQNFPTQGGGASQLALITCFIQELLQMQGIKYADAHFTLSCHDEVIGVAKDAHAVRLAKTMMWAHLLSYVFIHRRLNIGEICLGVAWPESIVIDKHWRKNPKDPCITDTNPEGFSPGNEYSMEDLYSLS